MAGLNNLSGSQFQQILRRLAALENAAPMNNGGVGRSGFEVYDGGTINVSNGNLIVNGTATIGGVLNVSGTLTQTGTTRFSGQTFIYGPLEVTGDVNLDGTTDVTGAFNVTGPTKLNGVTTIGGNTTVSGTLTTTGAMATKGTLSVEGVTTLKNDLNVSAGKKINLGSISLESGGATGGQINLVGGALSSSASFGTLLNSTTLELAGSTMLKLSGANIQMPNLPITASAANVYFNPANGRLYYKA